MKTNIQFIRKNVCADNLFHCISHSPSLFSFVYGLFQIQDKELKRNRMCISDIHRYVDHLREQLDELMQRHLLNISPKMLCTSCVWLKKNWHRTFSQLDWTTVTTCTVFKYVYLSFVISIFDPCTVKNLRSRSSCSKGLFNNHDAVLLSSLVPQPTKYICMVYTLQ